jgi:hypothetical protein
LKSLEQNVFLMHRRLTKKLPLIALLVIITASWAAVVSAHQHIEPHTSHCEVCLLPQLGFTATVAIFSPTASPATPPINWQQKPWISILVTAYRSRAPPA